MKADQLLQDRLERLEAGESLEMILANLPEEEGDLLFLAAQILAIPKPERNPVSVKKQQQKVIQAAKHNPDLAPRAVHNPFSFKWLIPVGIALLAFLALTSFWRGTPWFNNPDDPTPGPIAAVNTALPETRETEPVLDRTPISEQLPTPTNAPNPQTASLTRLHGIIQIQNELGEWITLQTAELKVGQTFRTWTLSSAQLVFFDGSMVTLGPNTQLTIETLNAQKAGARQISLFQSAGETTHSVSPSAEVGSSYLVHTPTARGEAKGTTFQVSVHADQNSSFAVIEGEVAVTGQQTTVSVTAGQITLVEEESAPLAPVIWLQTQGEVTQTGEAWTIGGETFQVHSTTLIEGSPKLGEVVLVHGRLLADGTRLADRIVWLAPALLNQFKFLGSVETIGAGSWTVLGLNILINETAQIDEGLDIGSPVFVRGTMEADGVLVGRQFQRVEENASFEFTGLIEQIEGQVWHISNVLVSTNAETEIVGEPVEGDLARVKGVILPDGTWQAREIEKVTEINSFEFAGSVEAIDPWGVSGISLGVNDQTQIGSDVEIGTLVRVRGLVLENGTWFANEILPADDEPGVLAFVGIVERLNPWVINGLPVQVADETVLVGEITLASLVRVFVRIQADGVWQVLRMELIVPGTSGCIEFPDTLASLTETEIVLQNGTTISRGVVEISGELAVGAPVLVQICYGPENVILFATLTVLETGDTDPTPVPQPTPIPTTEAQVTICHIPSGDPDKADTITVDASAVEAHLNHGDYLGPCQDSQGSGGGTDDDNGKNDDKGNGNNK